ncbi:MAG: metalloregulator ArsR/SmtB family transcription factor [Planctomycetota bacterium]
MHFFTVLSDPVRRRIVERLMDSSMSSGDIVDVVGGEFGISQSAISQQLKILRENRFAKVVPDGSRRIYSLDSAGFEDLDKWLVPFRKFWDPKFASLAGEVARGKRKRKRDA